eukprot:scaffold1887_cov239-Pinguiococcus_pyrenoidosus.AAC.1
MSVQPRAVHRLTFCESQARISSVSSANRGASMGTAIGPKPDARPDITCRKDALFLSDTLAAWSDDEPRTSRPESEYAHTRNRETIGTSCDSDSFKLISSMSERVSLSTASSSAAGAESPWPPRYSSPFSINASMWVAVLVFAPRRRTPRRRQHRVISQRPRQIPCRVEERGGGEARDCEGRPAIGWRQHDPFPPGALPRHPARRADRRRVGIQELGKRLRQHRETAQAGVHEKPDVVRLLGCGFAAPIARSLQQRVRRELKRPQNAWHDLLQLANGFQLRPGNDGSHQQHHRALVHQRVEDIRESVDELEELGCPGRAEGTRQDVQGEDGGLPIRGGFLFADDDLSQLWDHAHVDLHVFGSMPLAVPFGLKLRKPCLHQGQRLAPHGAIRKLQQVLDHGNKRPDGKELLQRSDCGHRRVLHV